MAVTILQLVGALLLPLFAVASSFNPFNPNGQGMSVGNGGQQGPFAQHLLQHEYVRFADVRRQCRSVLASAAELKFDANRAAALMPELSFVKGDWEQDGAPLMPFDGTDVADGGVAPEPMRLATFMLTHVDVALRGRTALNVSGVLGVAVSRNGTGPEMGPYVSPEFKVWPGSTEMKILFEGVYTETGDGESVLCMVGEALLPRRGGDAANPWDWAKNSNRKNFQPPVGNDKNILLVVRYPTTMTLATRTVRGELTSTNGKSDAAYFGAVTLLSQLGAYSNYKFGSEELVSTACSPLPYRDDVLGDGVYRGDSVCGILDLFTSEDVFAVVPNWKCNSTDALCRRFGPFETDKSIDATDGGFKDVGIVMQDIRCNPSAGAGEKTARVSAVFRAVPPWEHLYTAAQRSGLSGMTLAAEGVWRASTGQLCMVGCLGVGKKACHSRVCLYVRTGFSATQRSVAVGQITRIDGAGGVSHSPLTFKRAAHPSELWNRFGASGGAPLTMAYNYTKPKQAGEFLTRSEPFNFGTAIAKSLLSYPRVAGDDLSSLADELTLHVPAVPDPFPRERFERPFFQLEVFSLGPLVGRNMQVIPTTVPFAEDGRGKGRPSSESQTETTTSETTTSILNVSAELTLSGDLYPNVSTLSLEGVYNPVDGRMYLIGCRSIDAPWGDFSAMGALEDGMDCSIEVRVDYPPTTAQWLINPTAKVHIASTRDAGDPLRFDEVSLQTLPIMYRQQRQDILSRRSVEGILRLATLVAAIGAEFSQLMYIKANTDVMPYVSLVMLGVQALGYSMPLITGAEALFARIAAAGVNALPSYVVDKSQLYWMIDCVVKILVLAAFLLTLRLAQKVVRSRIRMLTRSPLEPGRVPSERKVILYSFGPHLLGFMVILLARYVSAIGRPLQQEDSYMDASGRSHALRQWAVTLEEYVGLAQDFFLLPQVVGNVLWRINCRPLKKSYYVSLTVVRLLPHLYDYIRAAPAINPYFAEEYEFVNTSLDFYSSFGDVAIPLLAVALAAAIYVQQRWNYKIISRTVKTQQKKLQHLGSRVYERLPSMSSGNFEAELVAGVNEATVGPRRDASLT
jgi:hypothetical protein